ncbi:hypothetical protein CR513_26319, partial [Mucuna pruriens]
MGYGKEQGGLVRFPPHVWSFDRGVLNVEDLVGEINLGGPFRLHTDDERRGARRDDRGHNGECSRREERRERSRSLQRVLAQHPGTIATISRGRSALTSQGLGERRGKHKVQTVLTGVNLTPLGGRKRSGPSITFDDRDMKHRTTGQDKPMVIYVVEAEYKIERVLVDQVVWPTFCIG